jgi:hypothetical protein
VIDFVVTDSSRTSLPNRFPRSNKQPLNFPSGYLGMNLISNPQQCGLTIPLHAAATTHCKLILGTNEYSCTDLACKGTGTASVANRLTSGTKLLRHMAGGKITRSTEFSQSQPRHIITSAELSVQSTYACCNITGCPWATSTDKESRHMCKGRHAWTDQAA